MAFFCWASAAGNRRSLNCSTRHALAGLGHPADIEKVRQAAIDAAHTEAFTRAPEDVSLRRLVSFGLSPQLKTNFEQIFHRAVFGGDVSLWKLARNRPRIISCACISTALTKPHHGGVVVAASQSGPEAEAQTWLSRALAENPDRKAAADVFLQAWWGLIEGKSFAKLTPNQPESQAGWRGALKDRVVEIGWLARQTPRLARYEALTLTQLGL